MDSSFEWDQEKNLENQAKHGLSFEVAQYAFADLKRVVAHDLEHSGTENRYFCFGAIEQGVVTVRFTYRNSKIRIIGAGFWRKGKSVYEKQNKVLK